MIHLDNCRILPQMGTRGDEQPVAGKEHKRADATSRNTFKFWARRVYVEEYWARRSPAESGCFSTFSKSCHPDIRTDNVNSED